MKNNKENKNNKQLVRDPVCGMWFEPEDAADETMHVGRIFYFCAPGCKIAFEREPEKFISENLMKENRVEE